MKKLYIGIVVAFITLISISVLSNKTVPKSQVREDLMKELSTGDWKDVLRKEEEIKSIKYLITKTLDKDSKELHLPVVIKIENEYISGEAAISLYYQEEDGEWHLDSMRVVNKTLTLSKGIDPEDFKKMVVEKFESYEAEEIKVEKVEMKETEIDDKDLAEHIQYDIVYNNGTVQYTQNILSTFKYHNVDDSELPWRIENSTVKDNEQKLISGINEPVLRGLLDTLRVDDWVTDYEGTFEIENSNEVQSVSITNQKTNFETLEDEVTVHLKVKKGNIIVEGNLDLTCYYSEVDGWFIDDIHVADKAKYTLINDFSKTNEEIIEELIGKNFRYVSNRSWTILEGETVEFSIEESSYENYGTTVTLLCPITLLSSEHKTDGKLLIEYKYSAGEWNLVNLERKENFNVLYAKDYKDELNEVKVTKVLASSEHKTKTEGEYSPSKTIDNSLSTIWVEGTPGDGKGEWIKFEFSEPQNISLIELNLGYQRLMSSYNGTLRPKKLALEFSDGTTMEYNATDVRDEQYLILLKPIKTDSVKMTILDVYGTDKNLHNCISEVGFYATDNVSESAD